MPLSKDFPLSPYVVLEPEDRWVPDAQQGELDTDILIPPLVRKLREKVKEFRDNDYKGASEVSKALLKWWFHEQHFTGDAASATLFRYYFAQQEAMETIIYLYDVAKARKPQDLLEFSTSPLINESSFDESWLRMVVKMATGSGKTKIVSLAIAWSYFHRLYEKDSELSRNFLVICPNVIVLDRLCRDFENLRIFHDDPVIPTNGWFNDAWQWQEDFHCRTHRQANANVTQPHGNIFLTNIQQIYVNKTSGRGFDDTPENAEEYFLGRKPKDDPKKGRTDLGELIRNMDELMVFNDEAHHIHDEKLQWYKSIQDIHFTMLQNNKGLALQIDTTATPKNTKGAIFPQVISDYPLVEAIHQGIVKQPMIPDDASQEKLQETDVIKYTQRYADFIRLGVKEWEKVSDEHKKQGKKGILFIMADNTKNCDEIKEYLEAEFPYLVGRILVIHTNNDGNVKETGGNKADKDRLQELRGLANTIDDMDNPYEVVLSVLMLKEGWDVRNVTTIVGLRAFSADSNILPEQALGRGLRRMYPEHEGEENVAVIGTKNFMDFIQTIKEEGVYLHKTEMGDDSPPHVPTFVMIDKANEDKDLDELNIKLPILSIRFYRNYENITDMQPENIKHKKIDYKLFNDSEKNQFDFKGFLDGEIKESIHIDSFENMDYRIYLHQYATTVRRELKIPKSTSLHNIFYGHMRGFIQNHLFDREVDLDDKQTVVNTLMNLREEHVKDEIINTFKKAINENTIDDKGTAQVIDYMDIIDTKNRIVNKANALDFSLEEPRKCLFNRIICDNDFELRIAEFLDECPEVVSFVKNDFYIGFVLDYVKKDGDIAKYYTDFIVKLTDGRICIIETKGAEYENDAEKWKRLNQWCKDANNAQNDAEFSCLYVEQEKFDKYNPKNFENLIRQFTGNKPKGF